LKKSLNIMRLPVSDAVFSINANSFIPETLPPENILIIK